MKQRVALVGLLGLLLSACATGGRETDFCIIAQPVLVSKTDTLTEETARQILAHNEVGRALCGW
jgi:hypothetical protein